MSPWLVVVLVVCALLTSPSARAREDLAEANVTIAAGLDDRRRLTETSCESKAALQSYERYFRGIDSINRRFGDRETCFPLHKSCGWPASPSNGLPLFVLSVGLEGAGHHLWTEILDTPVVDCLWINGRHYQRDVGDGVPRTTVAKLESGFREQFQLRLEGGKPKCKTIYDAEDSFPTGAIRRSGRVFMRPDIINLQKLDGHLLNVKYLLILRNVTDTALSALRRNFFTNIDTELRTVEHTLSYLEAALRGYVGFASECLAIGNLLSGFSLIGFLFSFSSPRRFLTLFSFTIFLPHHFKSRMPPNVHRPLRARAGRPGRLRQPARDFSRTRPRRKGGSAQAAVEEGPYALAQGPQAYAVHRVQGRGPHRATLLPTRLLDA